MDPRSRHQRSQKIFTSPVELQNAIMREIKVLRPKDKCLVITFVGGSASGKTSVAARLGTRMDTPSLLFSQDRFQRGIDFPENKITPYRFDDPRNFDLPGCEAALSRLAHGEAIEVSDFDMLANHRTPLEHLEPEPIIIWEGIYAAYTPELVSLSDLIAYIDVPYGLRTLRRIARHFRRAEGIEIDNLSLPAYHMLNYVLKAEKDFVASQEAKADYVLKFRSHHLENELKSLEEASIKYQHRWYKPNGSPIHSRRFAGITFNIYEDAYGIFDHGRPLYVVELDPDTMQNALKNWQTVLEF
jgi:uridine kinase